MNVSSLGFAVEASHLVACLRSSAPSVWPCPVLHDHTHLVAEQRPSLGHCPRLDAWLCSSLSPPFGSVADIKARPMAIGRLNGTELDQQVAGAQGESAWQNGYVSLIWRDEANPKIYHAYIKRIAPSHSIPLSPWNQPYKHIRSSLTINKHLTSPLNLCLTYSPLQLQLINNLK